MFYNNINELVKAQHLSIIAYAIHYASQTLMPLANGMDHMYDGLYEAITDIAL